MAVSASLFKQLDEQWQDDFFGRSDYPGELVVAPHSWWSDGETEPAVNIEELFLRPHSSLSRRGSNLSSLCVLKTLMSCLWQPRSSLKGRRCDFLNLYVLRVLNTYESLQYQSKLRKTPRGM